VNRPATGSSPSFAPGTGSIPYARHSIDDADVSAVDEVLRSAWLTTGPKVAEFEAAMAARAGTDFAVGVSSGTAALHAALHAAGVGPGDEVIVPAITFAATANSAVYMGATPVFADVDPHTLLVDPASVVSLVNDRTKALIAVDYAGQPCDYDELRAICDPRGIVVIADACHAIGATYGNRPVGSLATMSAFSFHPAKHVTSGEGGMVTTSDPDLDRRLRVFRNHGIDSDHHQRAESGTWEYDMSELGFNYRLSDVHSALGLSQLGKLDASLDRRRQLAAQYEAAFAGLHTVSPLAQRPGRTHAYHLFVVRLNVDCLDGGRAAVFSDLSAAGIGVNVHYRPVYQHSFYRDRFGDMAGACPNAESAYESILTLPLFPAMTDADMARVVATVAEVLEARSQ
jgi:perosamine synthetase